MNLGNQIKELRAEKKISQNTLGKILSISQDTISLWEKNKSKPDIDMLKKLCVIFCVTADELLEIETEAERKKIVINNSFNNNNGKINFNN